MKPLSNIRNPLGNERGIALILGIILILAITLFGMVGMTISTREIRGAGANRLSEQRYYEAQAGLSEALLNPTWLTDKFLTDPVRDSTNNVAIINTVNGAELANVTILNIQDEDPDLAAARRLPVQPHTTEPPAGSGYSLGKYQARRFSVTSATAPDGRRIIIREGVWRVFVK
jgi:hypothetical protein